MTACSTQLPKKPGELSDTDSGKKVRQSPVQIPAEVDPPPVQRPGFEGEGLPATQPPSPDSSKDSPPHS